MVRAPRLILSVSGAIAILLVATAIAVAPAGACTSGPPPRIEDIVAGKPIPDLPGSLVVGVFEQEHIASAPGAILTGPHTVSVVTRYWGTPPPNTYLQRHGQTMSSLIAANSCGNGAGELGMAGYMWVDEADLSDTSGYQRGLPAIDISPNMEGFTATVTGKLSPEQETMLAGRFGPPVAILIGQKHRVAAYLLAWRDTLIMLALIAGLATFAIERRSRRRRSAERRGVPLTSGTDDLATP